MTCPEEILSEDSNIKAGKSWKCKAKNENEWNVTDLNLRCKEP